MHCIKTVTRVRAQTVAVAAQRRRAKIFFHASRALCALTAVAALSGCNTPAPQGVSELTGTLPASGTVGGARAASLAAHRTAHTVAEYRLDAAARLVAANPGHTYTDPSPEVLLAIPVLEIEVNADGSVRNIAVLREPTQALDTVQLAIDAVHRAAPFGDATELPSPRRFSEVFLFDDERRFKPRSLD